MADEPQIITAAELASYLGVPASPSLDLIVELTNALIYEAWANPTDPAPASVKVIALTVASRAAANPKGLTSWTRSWDDVTRTERMEAGDRQLGIYLTDAEYAALAGVPVSMAGTIHVPLAGYGGCRSWLR